MKTIISPFLIFLPLLLVAQNDSLKHDYIWLTGYDSNPDQLEFGGTVFDFHSDTLETYYEYRDFDFDATNTTMCSENGELLFSTNGLAVYNSLNELMENGYGLNPEPAIFQERLRQGALALPAPGIDSVFYLLHGAQQLIDETIDGNWTGALKLYKTIIDMRYDALLLAPSLGQVTEKNVPIIEDTTVYGRTTATRHGNGRDWWILQQEYGTNKFYTFLLTPEGLQEQEPQYTGENQLYNATGIGQAVFSPDGSQYILINAWDFTFPSHIDFFDFDRCTGLLSNFERIELNVEEHPRGIAVSPNSRWVYLATTQNYYQIDLEQNPKQLSFLEARDTDFSQAYLAQLAPNGKIYFSATGTHPEMHVIHNPDEAGVACNLEQGGLPLPTYNNRTIPNHPNYRLGRLHGSPCDTLVWADDTTSIVNVKPEIFEVFPNPTQDYINFTVREQASYILRDYLGKIVESGVVSTGENRLELPALPSGIYFMTLKEEVPRVARFVVVRD